MAVEASVSWFIWPSCGASKYSLWESKRSTKAFQLYCRCPALESPFKKNTSLNSVLGLQTSFLVPIFEGFWDIYCIFREFCLLTFRWASWSKTQGPDRLKMSLKPETGPSETGAKGVKRHLFCFSKETGKADVWQSPAHREHSSGGIGRVSLRHRVNIGLTLSFLRP